MNVQVAKHVRAKELSRPSLDQRGYRDPGGMYSADAPFWSKLAGARSVDGFSFASGCLAPLPLSSNATAITHQPHLNTWKSASHPPAPAHKPQTITHVQAADVFRQGGHSLRT